MGKDLVFSNKILLSTSLIVVGASLVSFLVNLFVVGNNSLALISLACGILFLALYIFGRLTRKYKTLMFMMSAFSLLLLNFAWFYFTRSKGPYLIFFFILYFFMLFVWDKKWLLYITILFSVNTFALFIIELLIPNNTVFYINEYHRLIDVYSSFILGLVVVAFYLIKIKSEYQQQYMNAEKSDKLKAAFLANFSHEIRTPLNAIIGFSDILINSELEDKEKQEYHEIIENNSDDLLKLIDGIIDVAKIDSNQYSIELQNVVLNRLFEKVFNDYKNILTKTKPHIQFILSIPDNDVTTITDPGQLAKVLKNVLNNAEKFTDNGEIVFGFEIENKQARVFITDTGIGIKEEDFDKIFTRFSKVENSSFHYRGTGIGLFLCKKIVELLKGEMSFFSVYGKGSTFYFTLPIIKG